MSAAVSSSRWRAADPAGGVGLRIVLVALDERHDGDAGLEPRQPQRQFREQQQRHGDHSRPAAVLDEQRITPSWQVLRMGEEVGETPADDDDVQQQVGHDQQHRQADRLAKPAQEDGAQAGEEDQRHRHRMLDPVRHERVLEDVGGRVGRRQRDGDDVVGRREAEEAQDERLALPARQQLLQQRDAALTPRAEPRDLAGRPAARRRASAGPGRTWQSATAGPPRRRRWTAGSRASRSSRRRSGT